jgi:hypothetical protein
MKLSLGLLAQSHGSDLLYIFYRVFDVSEEVIASIFRAQKRPSMKSVRNIFGFPTNTTRLNAC